MKKAKIAIDRRLTRQLKFSDVLIGLPVLVQQFDLRINGPFSCFG